MFTLDQRPFQAALQQAQAVLARDTATLQNAQAQQSRLENLFQRGLIAQDQYETQRASAAALAATVEADKAAVETARLNAQYTEIKAPLSGRTGALQVHVGDLVRANDTNPLVVINQMSPVYVTFSVPGRFLGDIRRYQAQRPLAVTASRRRGLPLQHPPPRRARQPATSPRRRRVARARRHGRPARLQAVPRGRKGRQPGTRRPRGARHGELHRQRGGRDDRHDPAEGHVSRTPTRSCGPAPSSR